ncbi:MAG: hypothetical protein H7A23_14765 [Leptospiraceae bacterium]|nr:hypothetical protein [Leptospiraceae bacterium]MCP5495812.1 hypothetical protein [Leptospiraceae bacterium]
MIVKYYNQFKQFYFSKHALENLQRRAITKKAVYLTMIFGECRPSGKLYKPKTQVPYSQYRSEYILTFHSILSAAEKGIQIPDYYEGLLVVVSIDKCIITVIDKFIPNTYM